MIKVIIGVSGCSGGTQGPAGLYKFLARNTEANCKFIAIPTIPDNLLANIENLQKVIFSQLQTGDADIYLMGYSMGGAVAAVSAYNSEQMQKGVIKGVILLSPQTDGLHVLQSIDVPVLMIQGREDEYFSAEALEKIFIELPQKKEMILIDQAKHNLMPQAKITSSHILDLANKISEGVKDVFGFKLVKSQAASQHFYGNWLDAFLKLF